jgi:hypothetical protein
VRPRRPRLFNILSLLPCALLVALWARSAWWTDSAWYGAERSTFGVNSEAGRVLFVWARGPYPPLGFAAYRGRHRSPWWHHVKHLVVFRAFDSGNRSWVVQVPHWAVAAVTLAPVVWHRRRHRRAPGHCPECGYDLRATPNACPECGHRPGDRIDRPAAAG